MEVRIEILPSKKMVGCRVMTSLNNDKTYQAWRSFMPMRKLVQRQVNSVLVSLSVYDADYFSDINIDSAFEKWALVEVSEYENIPEGMETFDLPGGLYAVFDYKGSSTDTAIYYHILNEWLPASRFQLDDRPHFEILGENYRNDDSDSEEEIWIPIKQRLLYSILA